MLWILLISGLFPWYKWLMLMIILFCSFTGWKKHVIHQHGNRRLTEGFPTHWVNGASPIYGWLALVGVAGLCSLVQSPLLDVFFLDGVNWNALLTSSNRWWMHLLCASLPRMSIPGNYYVLLQAAVSPPISWLLLTTHIANLVDPIPILSPQVYLLFLVESNAQACFFCLLDTLIKYY